MKKVLWIVLAVLAVVISFQPLLYLSTDMRNGGLLSTKSAELLADNLYQIPFYIHIIFGGIALLIGWPQFNKHWRNKYLNLHRNLGKGYMVTVLISGSTGWLIAANASGGTVSKIGFLTLAVLWLYTTLKGYLSIVKKKVAAHEKWMIRSYALCFAAVTLRLWIPIFMMLLGFEFLEAYKIIAWLAWVPNLIVAEIIIYSKTRKALITA